MSLVTLIATASATKNANRKNVLSADTKAPDDFIWERQHWVHQALERLDPPSRQLLIALSREPSSPSYRDIANRLGIAKGSDGRLRAFEKPEAILSEIGFVSSS